MEFDSHNRVLAFLAKAGRLYNMFIAKSKRLILSFTAFAALAGGVHAQSVNNDYYDPQNEALLRTVERYHLYPGQELFRQRRYDQAYSDFLFILRYFPNHPQTLVLMLQ